MQMLKVSTRGSRGQAGDGEAVASSGVCVVAGGARADHQ